MPIVRINNTIEDTDARSTVERIINEGGEIIAFVYNAGESTYVDEPNLTAKACDHIADIFRAIARAKRSHAKRAH